MSQTDDASLTNALSFDLEHWYDAALLQDAVTEPTDHLRESTSRVLSILDTHDVTATFFVVGEIARTHPDLVARIDDAGHELGSHGDVHRPISAFGRDAFRRQLERSADSIEAAAGTRPRGFRAPNFSLDGDTAWAPAVLAESDYRYDSSVFPCATPMYGVAGAPRHPYAVRPGRPFEAGPGGDPPTEGSADLLEAPLAVAGRHVPVPVAGGFYARTLPDRVLSWGLRWLNGRDIPATLYFHPWEFNPAARTTAPRIDRRLVSFYGAGALADTLERLLASFSFGPVASVLSRTIRDGGVPNGRANRATSTVDERATKPRQRADVRVGAAEDT